MNRNLARVALLVRDYDEAIDYYVGMLGFELVEDAPQPERDKRWVVVKPKGEGGMSLVLARASTPHQEGYVGDQAGGRVFLFLHTEDFRRDFAAFKQKGVVFVREPMDTEYGTVAVFRDIYGNLWDLIGPA